MRVTLFVTNTMRIEIDRVTRTLSFVETSTGDDRLTLHFAGKPAVQTVWLDKLVEAAQTLRADALRQTVREGEDSLGELDVAGERRVKLQVIHEGGVFDSPAGAGDSVEADRG